MAFGTAVAIKALLANSEVARVTMRFTRATEPSAADLAALAEEVASDIDVPLKALYCSDISAFSVGCQNFTHVTPGSPQAPYWGPSSAEFGNVTPIGPGVHAGQSSPPQVAVVASLKTALPGPSFRGRLFGFPPPESEVDASGIIAGTHIWVDLVSLVRGSVEASANIDSAELCVFSAKLDSAEPVVAISQGPRVDTQRRRLARSG